MNHWFTTWLRVGNGKEYFLPSVTHLNPAPAWSDSAPTIRQPLGVERRNASVGKVQSAGRCRIPTGVDFCGHGREIKDYVSVSFELAIYLWRISKKSMSFLQSLFAKGRSIPPKERGAVVGRAWNLCTDVQPGVANTTRSVQAAGGPGYRGILNYVGNYH